MHGRQRQWLAALLALGHATLGAGCASKPPTPAAPVYIEATPAPPPAPATEYVGVPFPVPSKAVPWPETAAPTKAERAEAKRKKLSP